MRNSSACGGVWAVAAVVSVVGAGASIAGAQTGIVPRYRLADLGTVPASTVCPCFSGHAVSDAGHVTGLFFGTNGRYHAFLWHDGVMIDIGSLGGGVALPRDVNSAGAVTGFSDTVSDGQHAFIYLNGVMTDLGTLGGMHSDGRGINSAGAVVGVAQTGGRNDWQRATLWFDGDADDLGTFDGEFSEANAINDAGHVVGWAWDGMRRQKAFLWRPGQDMLDLGHLGGTRAIASGINDLGVVVGHADTPADSTNTHAFRWENGVMIDLGILPEAGAEGPFGPELVSTAAAAVNNAGIIVGNSYPGSLEPPLRPGPFVWQNGVMRNLNDLIDPASGAGWIITAASDVNDSGQIAGSARSPAGASRAVLLTPMICRADFNGSGSETVQDIFDFLAAYFAGDSRADVNGAGGVSVQDIFDFLAAYFAGC